MKVKKLLLFFALMCMMSSQVVMASAGGPDVRDQIKFLEEEPRNDIFSGVTDVVEDLGASAVRTVRAAGVAIIFVAALVAGIGIAVTKGGQGQQEKKARLIWLIAGAVIFFGGMAVIIWAGDIGAALYGAASGAADAADAVTMTPAS